MDRSRAFGASLFCAFLSAMSVGPAAGGERAMATGQQTSQPIGHFNYCRQATQDCTGHGGAPAPVDLDPQLMGEVAAINVEINAAIRPGSDREVYGVEERWTLPAGGRGDCEDFALLKRQRLMRAGVAAGNLLLTVVRKPDGEGHAILTLRTTQGDFVLDNLDWRVKPWSEAPYTFVKRQNPVNAGRWDAVLAGGEATLVAATKR